MYLTPKLVRYLNQRGIPYEIISHPVSYTALKTAEAEHKDSRIVAKVVMVEVDGGDMMFVLPADRKLDREKIVFAFGAETVLLEEEKDFREYFPDCETGAMPPFGRLYGIPCCIDMNLAKQHEIIFNAGSHTEGVKMKMKDYLMLMQPQIGDYSIAAQECALDV